MESPFKGKTGLRRIWNAFHYSLDGLSAAYRHEDAFRQETWLALVALPLALYLEKRRRNGLKQILQQEAPELAAKLKAERIL